MAQTGDTQTLAAQTTTNTNNAVMSSIDSTLSSLGLGSDGRLGDDGYLVARWQGDRPVNRGEHDPFADEQPTEPGRFGQSGCAQCVQRRRFQGSTSGSRRRATTDHLEPRPPRPSPTTSSTAPRFSNTSRRQDYSPGTLDATAVGNLWANDVSTDEVSTRLTTDYANAANAWNNIPGFKDAMAQQGMTSLVQLVGYYINPTNTLQQINQQIQRRSTRCRVEGNTGFGAISGAQSNAPRRS